MANPKHLAGRTAILQALKEELLGPAPAGVELDFDSPISFENRSDSFGPFCQKGTGEEVLLRNGPSQRYDIGVLYPFKSEVKVGEDLSQAGDAGIGRLVLLDEEGENAPGQPENGQVQTTKLNPSPEMVAGEANEEALALANAYRPSSIAISFLTEITAGTKLVLRAKGGRYLEKSVMVEGRERTWWLRQPVSLEAELAGDDLLKALRLKANQINAQNTSGLDLRFEVLSRPYGQNPQHRLLTVALVNRTGGRANLNEHSLYQATFEASVVTPDSNWHILPYPAASSTGTSDEVWDEEEASIDLLYRNTATYAAGHGCAADWHHDPTRDRARCVIADPLPVFQTPSVTPNVVDGNGQEVQVSMAALAGLVPGDNGFRGLEKVISLYEEWIGVQEAHISGLASRYHAAAYRHIANCQEAAVRMRSGMAYLHSNPLAFKAFQLANHAVLAQQARSRPEPRRIAFDEKVARFTFDEPYPEPDLLNLGTGRGTWRPFQIAFLLMTLEPAANGQSPDRETVELIWFPTGGGKTEAYLGLAAFAMFMRRLQDPISAGVHVLMRYTLRLLTTQQFQRAARLICAMEMLRRQDPPTLGGTPFSIGMWVGSASTPNKREEAIRALNSLRDSKTGTITTNSFAITQCPWCGAEMGPLKQAGRRRGVKTPRVAGYNQSGGTVIFQCEDRNCAFAAPGSLPVYVIDEDVYEKRPTVIIGTVDKFALLAWRPEARSLFGLDESGQRVLAPPGLIIQDELHLISGPLGSMVGLYEAIIEELCTDRRPAVPVRPKIICSTATTRRYSDQINALYARPKSVLFPPPGLDAGDSFFARYARDKNGNLVPGRIYVGVHAPGLGSMQTTETRTFTALIQAPLTLLEEKRDPWWTLLIFFNSLRELGTSLSLFQSDVRDYQKNLINRLDKEGREWRTTYNLLELTGRANYEEVQSSLDKLSTSYPSDKPVVDVCLASSMLEVGVDIDRLALMAVVGQPKTTAQYIQVTGRIGRRWWESPGLVITLYAASRPRDRSHFEKFRSYHEKLYAQVEPASVTPFSPPALERALHAVILAYVRQFNDVPTSQRPWPYPARLIESVRDLLLPRIRQIDPAELGNFERVFERRAREWEQWQPVRWSSWDNGEDVPLAYTAGEYMSPEEAVRSWATPMSLRNVDAGCLAAIMLPPIVNMEEAGLD
jgi:hypothetical protein